MHNLGEFKSFKIYMLVLQSESANQIYTRSNHITRRVSMMNFAHLTYQFFHKYMSNEKYKSRFTIDFIFKIV